MHKKESQLKLLFICLFALSLIVYTGCEGDSSTADEFDPGQAEEVVEEANDEMETVLNQLINGPEPQNPGEIDFSAPYNLYVEALVLDPNNLDANFGAGLCGLLMMTQDEDFQNVWNEWEEYLNGTDGPFNSNSPPDMVFPSTADCFSLTEEIIPATIYSLTFGWQNGDPTIGDLQDLIANKLLPALNLAIARMEVVAADPNYEFIITPMMQGDPNEDALELDHVEICAAMVQLLAVRSFLSMAVAYDMDMISFDIAGMANALDQNSSFMGLFSDGAARLATSKSSLLDAAEYLEQGINFLTGETDDQSNDIIKIDGEVSQSDLDEILSIKDDIVQAMTGTMTLTEDWDDDPVTPEVEITFSFGSFFNGNIENFKQLAPGYTIDYNEIEEIIYLTWDANSFNAWTIPDPTFGGMMPGMTDSQFKNIMGMDADNWTKVNELNIEF